jgi:hypothetical protein
LGENRWVAKMWLKKWEEEKINQLEWNKMEQRNSVEVEYNWADLCLIEWNDIIYNNGRVEDTLKKAELWLIEGNEIKENPVAGKKS